MKELFFDLSRDATRNHILQTLLDQIEDGAVRVRAAVDAAGVPDRHHHDIGEVDATVDALVGVSDKVRDDMHGIYRILAQAEATVHGCPVEETHFHEVGNGAGIRNVAAICIAMEFLSPDRIIATPVQTGSGKVQCAHGLLDIPAPATKAILDRGIPVASEKLDGELCTPTSAAVIAYYVDEFSE